MEEENLNSLVVKRTSRLKNCDIDRRVKGDRNEGETAKDTPSVTYWSVFYDCGWIKERLKVEIPLKTFNGSIEEPEWERDVRTLFRI